MPRTYLLAVVLLLVCLPALAQSQKRTSSPASAGPAAMATTLSAAKTSDANVQDKRQTQDGDLSLQFTPLDLNSDHAILISPDGLGLDGVCYAIRSIVVARDSKDSDAVHFVRSSTCQPAGRYHFRTAELRQETPSH